MNAGGVPNTCKSSGKALHLVFDRNSFRAIKTNQQEPMARGQAASGDRIMGVEYTSGGRVSNTLVPTL